MRRNELLEKLILIARNAGDSILEVYSTEFNVRNKNDLSPVTDADEKAEKLILSALASLTPDVPVISEEAASAGALPNIASRFWLVDPLDGTKEFVSRNGEFTVNIALIEDGKPTLGVVFAPALNRLFAGAIHQGAFVEEGGSRRVIACRSAPKEGLTVVSSRSHGDADALQLFLRDRRVASYASAGSSLKFCMVAAGGRVTQLNGESLSYGKPGLDNPHFLAMGLVS
jgi:3'(2'), 5'-bisphosphate nucleotidase